MRKLRLLLVIFVLALFQVVKAEPIDSTIARQLAMRFYQQRATTTSLDQRETAQIVRCAQADITITGTRNVVSRDCYYVVNFDNGFVIIAADDRVEPILGYSTTGSFNPQNIPDNVAAWLEGYRQEIADVISNNRNASTEISQHWYDLKHNINEGSRSAVGPLLQTTWNQSRYYNNYCPVDGSVNTGHALTGCVATAIAQIIRYWEYPDKGVGSHTYTSSRYGTITADFNTNYDYSLMPNALSNTSSAAQVDAVAKLIYHAGVSVDMDYGPTWSGSQAYYAIWTLPDYFAYSEGIHQVARSSYTDEQYRAILKEELDNLRPILYQGGAHVFVCDGYDGNYFHFNWGWGGMDNGNFLLTSLTPGGDNYTTGQAAVIGITPPDGFWFSQNAISLSAPVGETSDIYLLEIRGVRLSNDINLTVSGNFQIGTSPSSLGNSAVLPAAGGTLYVQYVPSSSTPTTEHGELFLYSGSTQKSLELKGACYQPICNPPRNLTSTKYSSYVRIGWTAPYQDADSETIISWDSTNNGAVRPSNGYNSTYYMLQRYEVSDLSSFNRHYLDAISFIPREGITHCRIVAYQGGSYDGSKFNPGEQVLNQEVSLGSLTNNTFNRIKIDNPVIIDNSKELWFGVIASVDSGTILSVGNTQSSSSSAYNKGGVFGRVSGSYSEFALINYSRLSYNIPLKASLKKISGNLVKYELYKNDSYVCDISKTSTYYYDYSYPTSSSCRYEVYAVWDNACSNGANVTYYPTGSSYKPTVTTNAVTQTGNTTATCGGNVVHTGNLSVTARGVCWSTSHNPTISNTKTTDGSGSGTFSSSMTGLTPGQTYYVRAYATNSSGTSYGEEQSVTLYLVVPKTGSETRTISNNTVMVYDHAGPNGNYDRNCSGTLTLSTGNSSQRFEITGGYRTVNVPTYNYVDYVKIYSGSGTSGTLLAQGYGNGVFSQPITSTSSTITIQFTSTSYSSNDYSGFQLQLRKVSTTNPPTVTTNNVTNIAATTATCGGNVTATGGASVTSRGICWNTSQNPTTSNNKLTSGSGTGSFSKNITGLTPNTTYYIRAYATNSAGTSYGSQKGFTTPCNNVTINVSGSTSINYGSSTTLTASGASSYVWKNGSTTIGSSASITVSPTVTTTYTVTGTNSYGCTGTKDVTVTVINNTPSVPTVITNAVVQTNTTTATCGGNVTHNGNLTVTARGICWSTSHNPTISDNFVSGGSGTGSFSCAMTGLTPGTTYYVRAYATNSQGTSYGVERRITMYLVVPKTGSQTYTINSDTVRVYDHAGPDGNIDRNCSGTLTLNTGNAGVKFEITGHNDIEYGWDELYIYDGNSTSGTLLYEGEEVDVISTPITSTQSSITIAFYSGEIAGTDHTGFEFILRKVGTPIYSSPTVTTNNVSNISTTTATCGGNITSNGGANITASGVCYSTTQNPTTIDYCVPNTSGSNSFTSDITGLEPNTTYYVRAYAINSAGTGYGAQKTFTTSCNTVTVNVTGTTTINYGESTTLTASGANSYVWKSGTSTIGSNASVSVQPTATTTYTVTGADSYGCTGTKSVTVTVNNIPPTVTTNTVTNIGSTSATCGGTITASSGTSITARGVCYGTSSNPTINDDHTTNGSGAGSFTSNITGLEPNTTYYVRAYATYGTGTEYGPEQEFTTSCNTVTLNITGSTTINYGGSTTLTASGASSYEWKSGTSTIGTAASVTVNPTSTTTYTVTGTDSYGCTGTKDITVTVNSATPSVTTNEVSNITSTSAVCGGEITANGGSSVTSSGVCYSTTENPTTANTCVPNTSGTSSFTSNISGLTPNTTYYVRAYATNDAGTAYGVQKSFTTLCNTVTVNVSGTTTINYGGSTTLTASGANSYEWKSGTTTIGSGASITVNPTTTTTYTVTGTSSNGCTGTANVTVTVNSIAPSVTTNEVSSVTYNSAVCGGVISSDGGSSVTSSGVCYSTSENPTTANTCVPNTNGTGSFTSNLTGLEPNTTYYVRAYATNDAGTAYGEQKSFTTSCSTVAISIIGNTTVNYGESTTLTASGANSYEWKIGSTTVGNGSSITVTPTSTTTYTVIGTDLNNCTGTNDITVTVNTLAPVVSTNEVSNVTKTSATCGGVISFDGGSAIIASGVCWSTSPYPTISDNCVPNINGTNSFTCNITGLSPFYTYYVRAYATNSSGTSYGEQKSFTTINPLTFPVNLSLEDANLDSIWNMDNFDYANQWYFGQVQGFDNRKLYISGNAGVSNKYINEWSDVSAGIWVVVPAEGANLSFDYRVNGEAGKDYLLVNITNLHSILYSTLLQGANEWAHFSTNIFTGQIDTLQFSFIWINDNSNDYQYPAAIDNIVIDVPSCTQPSNLTATIDTTSALLTWTAGTEDQSTFIVRYKAEDEIDWNTIEVIGNTHTTLTNLNLHTTYQVQVKALCGTNLWSEETTTSFTTTGLCPTVTDFNFSNLSNTVILTWTAGGDEQNWQLQFKPSSASDEAWTTVPVYANPTTILSGLMDESDYDIRIKAICDETDANSQSAWATFGITTGCESKDIPYFQVLGRSQLPECWTADSIFSWPFHIQSTSNNSWLMSPTLAIPDNGYPVYVSFTCASSDDFEVLASYQGSQLDYFSTIYTGTATPSIYNLQTQVFTLPDFYKGREINLLFKPANSNFRSNYFEVSQCADAPTNLQIIELSSNSFSITWDANMSNEWIVEYKAEDATEWTTVPVTQANFSAESLSPNTLYQVRVKSICAGNHISNYSETLDVQTPCDAIRIPYLQNFDDVFPPDCWSQEIIQGTQYWTRSSTRAYFPYLPNNESRLITPVFDLSGESSVHLIFKHSQEAYMGINDELSVYYRVHADSAWVLLVEYTTEISTMTQEEIILPAAALTSSCQFYFDGKANDGYGIYLDDVELTNASTCNAITTLPYYEGFESSSCPAECWSLYYGSTLSDTATINQMIHNSSYPYAGNSSFRFSSFDYASDYNEYLISPELNVNTPIQVSFYYSNTASNDDLYFGYSTTNNNIESFTWTTDALPNSGNEETWLPYQTNLPVGIKYIAFKYYGDYAFFVNIDEVVIDYFSICGTPTVSVVNAMATITAHASSTPTAYELQIGEVTKFVDPSSIPVNLQTLFNLSMGEGYELSVRAICGEGDTSAWSDPAIYFYINPSPYCGTPSISMSGTVATITPAATSNPESYTLRINDMMATVTETVVDLRNLFTLEANHQYNVSVRANCGTSDGVSSWSPMVGFNVDYPPYTPSAYLKVTAITPIADACLINAPITIKVTNSDSTRTITDMTLFYQINEETAVREYVSLTTPLHFQESMSYTFSTLPVYTDTANYVRVMAIAGEDMVHHHIQAHTFYSQGFEYDEITSNITYIDADGDGYNWENMIFRSHGGNNAMGSESYADNLATILTPENWLILPSISIPANGAILDWWVAAAFNDYPLEHYEVVAITGSGNVTLFDETMQNNQWVNRSVSLNAFAGQNIQIAFIHNNCSDQYILVLDDISIIENIDSQIITYGPIHPLEPAAVPYIEDFTGEVAFRGWTPIDANGDNISMSLDNNINYTYNDALDANDWMISPCIELPAGNYAVSYEYKANSDLPESFEIFYGKGIHVEDMTTALASHSFSGTSVNNATNTITITEDGAYNFGFHATSLAGNMGFSIDNFEIYPVVNVVVISGENGTVTPNGNVAVHTGEDLTLSIVPDMTYHLAGVWVNGSMVMDEDLQDYRMLQYTMHNVTTPDTVSVSFTPSSCTSQTEVITACNSYTWHEIERTESDTYLYSHTTLAGITCADTLYLTINRPFFGDTSVNACENYEWHGHNYTESGVYAYTNECASADTLRLTINHPTHGDTTAVVCNSFDWYNYTGITESGDYTHTLTNAAGCDSVVTLHLTVNTTTYGDTSAIACNSFNWYNHTGITESGSYTHTLTNAAGCDSIVTLHLTVNTTTYGDTTAIVCNSFDWYNHTGITESGNYTHTMTNAAGCDSIVTLHLTVNTTTYGDTTAIACNSFDWYNHTGITESGNYTHTMTNAAGCDSVVTLHLTVNTTTYGDTSAIACNSFDWYNHTGITESGNYTLTMTNAAGCDSVVTLHLTVNTTTYGDTSAIVCNSFDWYNHTGITESGNYTHTLTNAAGCDSVVTLHLTVNTTTYGDTTAVVCESFDWYNHTGITESGNYTHTLTNAAGCDSVVTLHLTVNPLPSAPTLTTTDNTSCTSNNGSITVTAPTGDGYTYKLNNGTAQTDNSFSALIAGEYTVTVVDHNGCTASNTANINTIGSTVTASASSNTPCVNDMLQLTASTNSENATFSWTGPNNNSFSEQNPTITNASSNDAGTYTVTVTDIPTGCSTSTTVNVTIKEPVIVEISKESCGTYYWNNTACDHTGNYVQSFTAANGCDSIVTLHLTINTTTYGDTTAIVCNDFDWYNHTGITESGDYTHTLTNAAGCDSIVTLHLTVNTTTSGDTTAIVCNSFDWYNHIGITQSGDYTHTLTNVAGCDSVVTLHLTVNTTTSGDTTATVCNSFDWYNHTGITESGDYTHTLTNAAGCDSVVTLHLTVNTTTSGDTTAIVCNSFDWYNHTGITESGDYTHTLTNAAGCDSVVTLHLTVNTTTSGDTTAIVCSSFDWYNHTGITESGDYTHTLTNAAGCDSVITLHLTVNTTTSGDTTAIVCGSFDWYNHTGITESGDYTHILTNAAGCDSVVTLHLTVNTTTSGDTTAIVCNSFDWYNHTGITESGDYTHTLTNAAGCDSVVTLHLTVNTTTYGDTSAIVCGSFDWYNHTGITESGDYTHTLTNAAGCDSVVTLHLTVNTTTSGDTTAIVCGSFDWYNHIGITESGNYTHTLTNAAGCDSVVTLHLTVNTTTSGDTTAIVCGSFDWYNQTGITQSGDYTHTLTNAAGCDSVVTLHLTVNTTTSGDTTAIVCNSFNWYNHTGITESGDYTHTLTNAAGCDSVVTLHLTVNTTTSGDTSAIVCGSFDWYNHTGITESGDYTHTLTNAAGCDSVVTLHLTINTTTNGDTSAIVCGSFDWYNHTGITESGDYTHTLTNAAGCDSVVTLHLTVNTTTSGDTSAIVCGSFDWYNHTGITESGDYTHTLTNAAGCDSVVTLHLTVNTTTSGDTSAIVCGSFDWYNHTGITESGDYTHTLTNAAGCDSVVTLHLTVNTTTYGDTSAIVCGSFDWYNHTGITESGDYTHTLTNAAGCDSIVTLHLTIYTLEPTVTTNTVTGITENSASCGGNVSFDGGASVTACGVCWSTSQNPTIADSHTSDGSGLGSFTSNITGLTPNTTYYLRAYATNNIGTAYGEQETFTTLCNSVNLTISASTTIVNDNISIDLGESVTLTASGANSYQWSANSENTTSSGNGDIIGNDASITVSPTATTIYTVTGANQYGCTSSANISITVNTYFTLTINYMYNNGTIAATSYTETMEYGENYDVTSPTITGFTASQTSVTGVMGAENITIVVLYTPNTYTVTTSVYPANAGNAYISISGQPASASFEYNSNVLIIANANTGYTFAYWQNINNPQDIITDRLYYFTVTENVEYQAEFTPNTYHLYLISGAPISLPEGFSNDTSYVYGEGFILPTADQMIYEGHTFLGWYDNLNYTGEAISEISDTATGDITLYAQWSINSYTITYMDGNTVLDIDTFTYGSSVTPINNPTKTGYTFNGWSETLPNTMPAHDITVHAQWSINSYTITYMNGNTVIDIDTFTYGANITPIDDPTMTGYTFNGWSETLPNTMPAYDITVNAQWSINSYTITYMDGNTVLDIDTFTYGANVIPIDNPTKTGYTFNGWSETLPNTMPAYDITINAQWSINSYTITYMDGNTVLDIDTFTYGATITPIADPTMTGYTFNGWSETLPNTMPAYDIIVHAQWIINNYTITVNVSNDTPWGSVTGSGSFAYGSTDTLTATPNEHYLFAGWSDFNTDNPRIITVTQDSNFTAYFIPETFDINISSNDETMGTVTVNIEGPVSFNTPIVITATPAPHYHFVSWSDGNTDNPRTIYVTQALNLTAIFEIDQHTITVLSDDENMGSVIGGGTFDYGTVITFRADALEGYEFVSWNDNSTENPRLIIVEQDSVFTAFFRLIDNINDADLSQVDIFSYSNQIVICNAEGHSAQIFDMNGRLIVNEAVITQSRRQYSIPTDGIYLVKVGDSLFKKVIITK